MVFTRDTLIVEYLTYKTILLDSFCKHNFCQICKSSLLQVQISIFIYFSRLFRFSKAEVRCWVPDPNALVHITAQYAIYRLSILFLVFTRTGFPEVFTNPKETS